MLKSRVTITQHAVRQGVEVFRPVRAHIAQRVSHGSAGKVRALPGAPPAVMLNPPPDDVIAMHKPSVCVYQGVPCPIHARLPVAQVCFAPFIHRLRAFVPAFIQFGNGIVRPVVRAMVSLNETSAPVRAFRIIGAALEQIEQ